MSHAGPVDGPTVLYRLFDRSATLLYVGITNVGAQRLTEHAKRPWWHEVANVTFERFDSREEAKEAERKAIEAEGPIHNVQHKPRPEKGPVVVLNIRDVPELLHRSVKVAAIKRDLSIRDFVLRALENELDRLPPEIRDELPFVRLRRGAA